MNIQYIYYKSIDSTNNEIKRRLASDELPTEFTVVSAGTQTAGRGRIGHEWSSPEGSSVATSMVLYPKGLPEDCVPQLTIVAAMAVAYAIEALYGLPAQIKWTNDILLSEKKVCGILTERINEAVVVGIGVNVYGGSFPPELAERATCIADELSRIGESREKPPKINAHETELSRNDLTKKIWEGFLALYEKFLEKKNLSFLVKEYNSRLINAGRTVRILDPSGAYEARAVEMDEDGKLVVKTDKGQIVRIDSGEVHIRGQNGYV